MVLRSGLLLACLLASGCAWETPPADTARLPPNAFGVYADGDIGAINQAAWAFASPARTRNDPADAARAVAAVDYLAGELNTSPRWQFMSVLTKMEMLQARAEVRQAMGIGSAAPSQEVVNRMLFTADALRAGDQPAAVAALQGPFFSRPPQQTLAMLSNMPYLREANVASQHAAAQQQPGGNANVFDH